ncbi:MAG: hypothetical protein AAFV88_01760 [Planctomycetota bacterium]
MIGQQLSPNEQAELQQLMVADRMTIKQKYWSLPEPSIGDIQGDFDARLLDQGRGMGAVMTKLLFGMKGPWLGKGFQPESETTGSGYNTFGDAQDYRRELLMDTYIDHSKIIPGFAFILDYRHRNWGAIRWLRGELRAITPDLVLGIGTFGPRPNVFRKIRRVIPFVLVRSTRETAPQRVAA